MRNPDTVEEAAIPDKYVSNVTRLAFHEARRTHLKILFSDDHLLVIDKPAGIPSRAGESAEQLVRTATNDPGIAGVHRLDTETSGVLVFGRTRKDRAALSQQFAQRTISKQYIALVEGAPGNIAGIIAPLLKENGTSHVSLDDGAKTAATGLRQIGTYQDAQGRDYSLLSVDLFTGRTHQIRAHLAHLGIPIAGDKLYSPTQDSPFRRQMLHASRLTLAHPSTGELTAFHAPYPTDFPIGIRPIR